MKLRLLGKAVRWMLLIINYCQMHSLVKFHDRKQTHPLHLLLQILDKVICPNNFENSLSYSLFYYIVHENFCLDSIYVTLLHYYCGSYTFIYFFLSIILILIKCQRKVVIKDLDQDLSGLIILLVFVENKGGKERG